MLILCLVLCIIFAICTSNCVWDLEELWATLAVGTGIGSILIIIYCLFSVTALRDVDERIAMYEEQNATIASQVETAVKTYMKHEDETFKDATPDSYITLVSLYPELKSDSLMQKQIDVYIENNDKICDLKEEKITAHRYKFWLYFGK